MSIKDNLDKFEGRKGEKFEGNIQGWVRGNRFIC